MSTTLVICFLFLLGSTGKCQEIKPILPKIMDTLRVAVKMVERFVNSDQNYFLSKVFNKFAKTSTGTLTEFIPFLIKLFGFDPSKIMDYALDGVIMMTHLISVVFTNKENSRSQKLSIDFSPFQYLNQQPQVLRLYDQMQDPNLVDLIIVDARDKLKNYSPEEFDCILLLFCKTHPFVSGMQKSLRFFSRRTPNSENLWKNLTNRNVEEEEKENVLWEKANWEDRMFFFLPDLSEVVKYGDECDKRFPSCEY